MKTHRAPAAERLIWNRTVRQKNTCVRTPDSDTCYSPSLCIVLCLLKDLQDVPLSAKQKLCIHVFRIGIGFILSLYEY
ncbi:hypothetical protein PFLUV_G00103400 [Perca fluviatilis]|uniref:Uncharacterized protein n=1 Tax=Perca fluviatilis TaxID=8168 RepID=A0A6A5F643_PERFL|nr:hypothetical protein PFLUV_G00103400 [Perca fluviatilis]